MARITIRLSEALYDKLLLCAQGRNRGQPEFSPIVREALEAYLSIQRPTRNPSRVRRTQPRTRSAPIGESK
jgi:predicted transcriptional regulator